MGLDVGMRVGELRAAVDALAAVDLAALDDADVGGVVVAAATARDRLDAICHSAVACHDRRGAYKADGARSEKQWLTQRLNVSPGHAAGMRDTGRRLASLPRMRDAVVGGEVGWQQARVATHGSRDVATKRLAEFDELMAADSLGGAEPTALRRTAEAFIAASSTADPLAERERRAWENRRFSTHDRGDGSIVGDLSLPADLAELLATVIASMATPAGTDDERTPVQRNADALIEVFRQAAAGGCLPEVGGHKPHVTVVVSLDALRGQIGAAPALLDRMGTVSHATARMWSCDAAVSRVITDGASQPLDVGRATRTVSAAIRKALSVRDAGCIGCAAPAGWCDAHHVRFWADGGATNLDNLALLCHRCHRDVHHHRAELAPTPNGGWRYTRHSRLEQARRRHRSDTPPSGAETPTPRERVARESTPPYRLGKVARHRNGPTPPAPEHRRPNAQRGPPRSRPHRASLSHWPWAPRRRTGGLHRVCPHARSRA